MFGEVYRLSGAGEADYILGKPPYTLVPTFDRDFYFVFRSVGRNQLEHNSLQVFWRAAGSDYMFSSIFLPTHFPFLGTKRCDNRENQIRLVTYSRCASPQVAEREIFDGCFHIVVKSWWRYRVRAGGPSHSYGTWCKGCVMSITSKTWPLFEVIYLLPKSALTSIPISTVAL